MEEWDLESRSAGQGSKAGKWGEPIERCIPSWWFALWNSGLPSQGKRQENHLLIGSKSSEVCPCLCRLVHAVGSHYVSTFASAVEPRVGNLRLSACVCRKMEHASNSSCHTLGAGIRDRWGQENWSRAQEASDTKNFYPHNEIDSTIIKK